MKSITAVVLALVLTGTMVAQDKAALEKSYAAKLDKDFAKLIKWESTLDAAMKRAKSENKLIVGYFTRSYAP